MAQVAHFAVWDEALTKAQVEALLAAYDTAYPPITVEGAAVDNPYATRQGVGLGVGVLIGLLPALISCACAKKAGDWQARVRSRGRLAMLSVGWLLVVLSLTPTFMFVIGQDMSGDPIYLLYFALMLPVGAVCFMLSAVPADLSGCMVPALYIAFYVVTAVCTGGLGFFWAGGTLQIVAIVWFALCLLGALASGTACLVPKSEKQAERKLLRLWLTSRLWFLLTGVSFLCLLIDSPWFNARYNIAYIIVGLDFLLLAAVTTPKCRSAFCVMIATLGLGGSLEAKSAARLVFTDLSSLGKPLTSPGEQQMAVTA